MTLLEELEARRAQLFALAYRMLGTVSEAEDVLQEAAIRAREQQARGGDAAVSSPRAWLTTIVTRLCLDQLKAARRRREEYVGPWLPEPLLTDFPPAPEPDARVGVAESISMAFLVLLERLSPLERAVFLLREVFDYDFGEIAMLLGRTEPACRQLFHRARTHIEQARPRFRPPDGAREKLTREFLRALQSGDAATLESLLAEDVRSTSDGGGKVHAARVPIVGAAMVTRFLLGLGRLARRAAEKGAEVRGGVAQVNGEPAVLIAVDGRPVSVVVPQVEDGRITALHLVSNPDKLRRVSEASENLELLWSGAAAN